MFMSDVCEFGFGFCAHYTVEGFVKIATRLMNVNAVFEITLFCTMPFKSGVNPEQM